MTVFDRLALLVVVAMVVGLPTYLGYQVGQLRQVCPVEVTNGTK